MQRFVLLSAHRVALIAAIALFLIAARCESQVAGSSENTSSAAPSNNDPASVLTAIDVDRMKWIETILHEAETIRPGMPRKELYARFRTEGGIYTRSQQRYVSKRCPYIKIDVTFKLAKQYADPSYEDPEDIIVTVSKPYLQWSIMD